MLYGHEKGAVSGSFEKVEFGILMLNKRFFG
jgi:hypothetical protein